MKYILDIILVIAVVWVVNLWNGQRLKDLAQSDEIARLTARVQEWEENANTFSNKLDETTATLTGVRAELEQAQQGLQEKTDALAAKEAEFERLQEVSMKLKARVDELQGLKDLPKQAYHVNAPKEEKASGGEE